MADRIAKPFALSGDKTAVPDDSSSTELSFDLGWSSAYELSQETAGSRSIDRGQHNQLWNTVTANIKEWQDQGEPEYQATVPYPQWMITRYTDGEAYICIEETTAGILPTNTDHFTPLNDFFNFGTAAYVDIGAGNSQVPTNAELGTAAYIDTGTDDEDIATNQETGGTLRANRIGDWDDVSINSLVSGYIADYNSSTANMPSQITDISGSGSLIVLKSLSGQASWARILVLGDDVAGIAIIQNGAATSSQKIYTESNNATSSQINGGVSTDTVITPSALSNSAYGFTVNQNRSLSSKTQGVTYTNTDDVAREVTVLLSHTSNNQATITIGGISQVCGSSGSTTSLRARYSFIVLSGETYSVAGASALISWIEVTR